MSIRRADLRLALPHPVRWATVLGHLPEWHSGLASAGVNVNGSECAQLVVAPARLAAEAVETGACAIVLEGRSGGRALERAGYTVRRFLPLPNLDRPTVVLPVDRGPALPYALSEWRPAPTAAKRFRDRLACALVRTGTFPPLRPEQVLGLREPGAPFAVAALEPLGLPSDVSWFMWLGQGDPLGRLLFVLFAPGEAQPSWILKLARVANLREPFDRDELGLGLATAAGPVVAAHAPALLGRLEVGGLQASVETAAPGETLSHLLTRDRKAARSAIDEIASWIVAVGTSAAGSLDQELLRLRDDVLPHWLARGAPADLVDRVPELDAVLQHNDLGSWNILVRGRGFVAVDWESAAPRGLPLWDLLYFLVDSLPLLEGALTSDERVTAAVRLLRGESETSPILFDWLRRAVDASRVPEDAVGPLATLCWLHHGLSHISRRSAAEEVEPGAAAALSPIDLLAPRWLDDPALGPEWKAWRT